MIGTSGSIGASRPDLVSLGEVMLRMSPPRFERLRRARSLNIDVAGAQLNVCANFARLGMRSAFVSKLPNNALGLLARDMCMSYGVDMSDVKLVDGERMGLNFLDFTTTPRAPVTIFDREGSAASSLSTRDFDWDAVVDGVGIVHSDGIIPGLSRGCFEATRAYFEAAKRHGCTTSFDMNYREHVWSLGDARTALSEVLPLIDVVVTSPSVADEVFGFRGDDVDVARHYAEAFGCGTVVVTHREMDGVLHGAWSSLALHHGDIVRGKRFGYEVVDRYGTGDAFLAGLLFGMSGRDVGYGLDFGNALCALSHTVEGDVAHLGREEVEAMLQGDLDLRPKR